MEQQVYFIDHKDITGNNPCLFPLQVVSSRKLGGGETLHLLRCMDEDCGELVLMEPAPGGYGNVFLTGIGARFSCDGFSST